MYTPNLQVHSHSCECTCLSCERAGAGYFAQRAALSGGKFAAPYLSPAILAFLRAQRHGCRTWRRTSQRIFLRR